MKRDKAFMARLVTECANVLTEQLQTRDAAIAELRAEVEVLRGQKAHMWKAGKSYQVGDVVTWNNRSWRCVSAHRSKDPSTDRAQWERL